MNPNYKEILKQIMDYKKEGARVLISGLLIKMMIGTFYAWPILHSYYLILSHYESWNFKFIFHIIFPLMVLTMNLAIPYSDRMLKIAGPNQMVLILTCLLSISLLVIGQFYKLWYLHFIIQVFIIAPILGLLYSIPFITTWKYFIKQKNHLNSAYQVCIGIGAFLLIYIFQSNQPNQLEMYYDFGQQYCAECFNLQIRQSFRAISIWIIIIGGLAAILIGSPDDDIAETVVDYDLLAFTHLEIPQQTIENEVTIEQLTFKQILTTNEFKIILGIALYCSFLPYLCLSQFQAIQKLQGISYHTSKLQFQITILIFGLIRLAYQLFLNQLHFKQLIPKIILLQIILVLLFIISIYMNNQYLIQFCVSFFVVFLSIIFATLSSQIPKLFGPIQAQQIFQLILIVMAFSCLIGSIAFTYIINHQEKSSLILYLCCLKILIGNLTIWRYQSK